jgi:hypothetical protein
MLRDFGYPRACRFRKYEIENSQILWSKSHVLKKVSCFLNLHAMAMGYPKSVTFFLCKHFWVNKSLSMMRSSIGVIDPFYYYAGHAKISLWKCLHIARWTFDVVVASLSSCAFQTKQQFSYYLQPLQQFWITSSLLHWWLRIRSTVCRNSLAISGLVN